MEKFLWLISHFPCRVAVIILGVPDVLWLLALYDAGKLKPYIDAHFSLLVLIGFITLLLSVVLAIIGGIVGYNYVEMGRSRFWLYRSTAFSRGDNTFENVVYWAGKFSLLPIIIVLLLFFIISIIAILKYHLITIN